MPQNSGKDYKARPVEVAQPLVAAGPVGGAQGGDFIAQPIAFTSKDYGADASDIAPTMRAMGHTESHANGGGQLAIAYGIRSDASRSGEALTLSPDAEGRMRLRRPGMDVYEELAPTLDAAAPDAVACATGDITHALTAEGFDASEDGTGRGNQRVATRYEVRRLTPRECDRLQAFPDDHALIPFRRGLMADGSRYKLAGNSMCVNVIRWIGEQLELVSLFQ